MIKRIKTNRRKGFTLIELIVVMAVIGILVLLAMPRFLGHTKEAQFTKHISNAKVLEDASTRYYIDHGKWPRGADEDKYTPEEVSAYAERIYDITGEELTLEEGNYWDIDYDALSAYAKLPDKSEQVNYVLRNPAGKVYYLDGLTEAGSGRIPVDSNDAPEAPEEPSIPDYYVMATDADFKKDWYGDFRYIGTDKYIIIPHEIQNVPMKSYKNMFRDSDIEGVVSTNLNVTNMSEMFYGSKSTRLDLSNFDTSNVIFMDFMFQGSQAARLDLSGFDTSSATNMFAMFRHSKVSMIDLSSFDTSKVKDMSYMFENSQTTNLDLSSFDVTSVTYLIRMFKDTAASTGYARTQADADRFNTSDNKPAGLTFTVNP